MNVLFAATAPDSEAYFVFGAMLFILFVVIGFGIWWESRDPHHRLDMSNRSIEMHKRGLAKAEEERQLALADAEAKLHRLKNPDEET